jgi:hypothetical protein
MAINLRFSEPILEVVMRGVRISGAILDYEGRLFCGHLHADPYQPDATTAFFSFGQGEFTVSPCKPYPGRSIHADTLSRAIDIAKGWIPGPQPPHGWALWKTDGTLAGFHGIPPTGLITDRMVEELDETGYDIIKSLGTDADELAATGGRDVYLAHRDGRT